MYFINNKGNFINTKGNCINTKGTFILPRIVHYNRFTNPTCIDRNKSLYNHIDNWYGLHFNKYAPLLIL